MAVSLIDRSGKSRSEGGNPCFGSTDMLSGYPEIKGIGLVDNKKKVDGRAEAVLVRLPDDLIQGLDALRRAESDPPTRPEMIRRILQAWIAQNPPKD